MSVTYFNENTGDKVEKSARSARLDALSNWQIIHDDDPEPEVVDDGVLSRPSTEPPAAPVPVVSAAETEPPPPPVEPVKTEDKAPAKSGSKADWQAYARPRAKDSDEAAAIEQLTRDELVALYGGGS